ncbi:pyridoxal-phosphate dependent enzyme [Allokutzneria oryzae]|uniref:Pyridoxal-phosphate dependent enzyme n=1 Tax=Allokutzneria oryzae TaxID=1378989 RepID=A0ABV6A5Y7_9PSEU
MTSAPGDWFFRPTARAWRHAPASEAAYRFHRDVEGYRPTPLVELPALAEELGVRRVLVKDESDRFGLPAFKVLGASWAVHRVLSEHADARVLVTATDGNHGRAVARTARRSGLSAHVVVPAGVHSDAVAAIAAEGAVVEHIDGSYDDAIDHAVRVAKAPAHVLVQDTDVPGHHDVPQWIVEGYSTLFREIGEQLTPDLLVVPVGVGSLAQAAITHHRGTAPAARTALLAVEPSTAAGLLASLAAGELVSVPTPGTSMAGLNCGTPSASAWPLLNAGLDAAVSITDRDSRAAATALVAAGVSAGPCGAASLAGARAALGDEDRRRQLGVDADSTVVLLNTEGTAANPAYAREN